MKRYQAASRSFLLLAALFAASACSDHGGSSKRRPVVHVNVPPVALDDAIVLDMDAWADLDVLANDTDPDGDPLTVVDVSPAAYGTASQNLDGTIRYSPNTGVTGTDTFTYTIDDGQGGFATANVVARVDYPSGLSIERASVATAGTEANADSWMSALAAGGRFVAFLSSANNLVAGAPGGSILVRDRLHGETTLASRSSAGVPGTGSSQQPTITPDGRFVAFMSWDSNLVPDDTNGRGDIFVHDRASGVTTRDSPASDGSQANDDSFAPSLSADGRYVAFVSYASNLVANDVNGPMPDVFVRDRQAGTTILVSIDPVGNQVGGGLFDDGPSLSADGTIVAFSLPGRIYVRDLAAGRTIDASATFDGSTPDGPSESLSLSADGRFVAFASIATNLVPADTNFARDVFVRDLAAGVTSRVSVASSGAEGLGPVSDRVRPALSADGRFVAFCSAAINLVGFDSNGFPDVFVHDRQSGQTARVNLSAAGAQANAASQDSVMVSISADGSYVAFASEATNLVADDTNDSFDVFVAPNPIAP